MVLNNNKGSALPLVLMVMMVVILLGSALFQYATQSIMQASMEEKRMQAYYLARSGIELIVNKDLTTLLDPLPDNPTDAWAYNLEDDTNNTALLNELNGSFSLKIYTNDSNTIIESTGKVDSMTETLIAEKDIDGNISWRKP